MKEFIGNLGEVYSNLSKVFFWGVSAVSFLGLWLYSAAEWGMLVGLAIGWLPALVGGVLAGGAAALLWPLAAVGALYYFA